MAGVAVDQARHSGLCQAVPCGAGRHFGHDKGEHHASAGADPQQVLTGEQRRDAQTRRLVLTDDIVRRCKRREVQITILFYDISSDTALPDIIFILRCLMYTF